MKKSTAHVVRWLVQQKLYLNLKVAGIYIFVLIGVNPIRSLLFILVKDTLEKKEIKFFPTVDTLGPSRMK